jgi:hypothetical protein
MTTNRAVAHVVLASFLLIALVGPAQASVGDAYHAWAPSGSPTTARLNAVADAGYAVGDGGVVLERVGGVWTLVQTVTQLSGGPTDLMDVTSNGYAVGTNGVIVERNSTTGVWEPKQTGTTAHFYGVTPAGYAVGAAGRVHQREAGVWTNSTLTIAGAPTLRDINDALVVVGDSDALYVHSGTAWVEKTSPNLGTDGYTRINQGGYAATDTGEIHGYNATSGSWSVAYFDLLSTGALYGIGKDFAVGAGEKIVQNRTNGWGYSTIAGAHSGSTTLRGVSEGGCYAVGDAGFILEREGHTCNPAPDVKDLTVTGISGVGLDECAGTEVVFSASVANLGTVASGPFNVTFTLDGALLATKAVTNVSAGGTVVVSQGWVSTAGAHSLVVVADSGGVVVESDETNNSRSHAFTVCETDPDLNQTRGPNLRVTALSLSPTPSNGATVTAAARVDNLGDTNATSFTVRFYHDGVPYADVVVPELAFGAFVLVNASFQAASGSHEVGVYVDFFGAVDESDETDNDADVAYNVGAGTTNTQTGGGGGSTVDVLKCPWLLLVAGGVLVAGVVVAAAVNGRRQKMAGVFILGVALAVYGLLTLVLVLFGLVEGDSCGAWDSVKAAFSWLFGG